ncbi:MAG TPA: hypothetical protein VNT76_02670, partial [Candidatus Binatus sp.]|nr:hypothetical protein [Candidatus Binatus sp.]
MQAAKNQDHQPESVNKQPSPAQPSGFGKVLGSLHGLQQRLDDFSMEDVTNADSNVKSLIQQITYVRGRLTTLAELKLSIATANEMISAIPEENFDLVSPDALEKHPQLHAIVQASKLIRFYRLMQSARASANAISLDSQTGAMVAPASDLQRAAAEDGQEIVQPFAVNELAAALGLEVQVGASQVDA